MLPIFQTDDQDLSLMQTKWAAQLNPLLELPLNDSALLPNVNLINGTTQVNHRLGRKPLGWIIIRQRASAIIYDTQDSNQHPELTLSLVSNAAVVVDLIVF